jgi:MFS family permease
MTVVSGAFSIYRLEAGIASPIMGYLLDRVGPQKLVFSGGLIMGGGFIYLSYINTVLPFYVAIIIISFGWSGCAGSAIGNPLVGKWFVKNRGNAIGIYNAAVGLSGLLVPAVAYLIVHYGWRSTLLIIGIITWLIVLPLSFALKHSPEQYGLLPDGETFDPVVYDAQQLKRTAEVAEVDFSLRTSMATSTFWILTVCFIMHQLTQGALFVHLIPYLIDLGINPTSSASVVSIVVLTSIVSRYGFGWLGDRFDKKMLLILLSIIQPIAIFSLVRVHFFIDIIPFVLLFSISYGGTIVVKATITGDYFGRRNFGTIFGAIQGLTIFGGVAGPLIAGWVYDTKGSYHLAFISFAIMMILVVFLILFLKRPILLK